MDEAQQLIVAYMPLKVHVHRVFTDLAQPWVAATTATCSCASSGSTSTSTWREPGSASAGRSGGRARGAAGRGSRRRRAPPRRRRRRAPTAPPRGGPEGAALRLRVAETGFDPAQLSDIYSRTVTAHVFEAPLHLRPAGAALQVRPLTAAAMPEVSDDFRTWTVRLKPGIYFADDPVFQGRRRELVAQDYVYTFKRIYDPIACTRPSRRGTTLEDGRLDDSESLMLSMAQKAIFGEALDDDLNVSGGSRGLVSNLVCDLNLRTRRCSLSSADVYGCSPASTIPTGCWRSCRTSSRPTTLSGHRRAAEARVEGVGGARLRGFPPPPR